MPCTLDVWGILKDLDLLLQGNEMAMVDNCPDLSISEYLSEDEKEDVFQTYKKAFRLAR